MINHIPNVCGGRAIVNRTRIPLWIMENYRRLGISEQEFYEVFPTLTKEDFKEAWEYIELHPEEIKKDILENEEIKKDILENEES